MSAGGEVVLTSLSDWFSATTVNHQDFLKFDCLLIIDDNNAKKT